MAAKTYHLNQLIPIKEHVLRTTEFDGHKHTISYDMLDTDAVLGYINDRLWSDVNSYAVIDISDDGKAAAVVQVEIPLAKTYDPKAAMASGVPEGIAVSGSAMIAEFKYGAWRIDGKKIKAKISQHCGYHYDLSF